MTEQARAGQSKTEGHKEASGVSQTLLYTGREAHGVTEEHAEDAQANAIAKRSTRTLLCRGGEAHGVTEEHAEDERTKAIAEGFTEGERRTGSQRSMLRMTSGYRCLKCATCSHTAHR